MRAITATIAIALLACCGCSDNSNADTTLRPADQVRADQIANSTDHQPLGTLADLGNGLHATVTSIDGTTTTEWGDTVVLATVRVENRGSTDAWPEYALYCAGTSTWPTGTDSTLSTFDPTNSIPGGSFVEGTVAIHLPNYYEDTDEPCEAPAWIDIRDSSLTGSNATWALPDNLLPLN